MRIKWSFPFWGQPKWIGNTVILQADFEAIVKRRNVSFLSAHISQNGGSWNGE